VTSTPSDPPAAELGAKLLEAVAVMDRLRSPGGCPWDAEQDHASLAPYLLEEAYEAFQAIEDGDLPALRDELGDVLLQVLFHARIAEELPPGQRWSIDDVAAGLVEKLTRRHPHVFGDVEVSGAEDVNRNWEQIKAAERGGVSPLASVPLSAPALSLATKLQRKAGAAASQDADSLRRATDRFAAEPSVETAGELLWEAVSVMRSAGIDPEAALRARAREFRDDIVERGDG
jgi:XTP/dITP diphosphohydrolase